MLLGRPCLCESGAGVEAMSPSQRRSRAHNSPRMASRSTSWESATKRTTNKIEINLSAKTKGALFIDKTTEKEAKKKVRVDGIIWRANIGAAGMLKEGACSTITIVMGETANGREL